MSRRRPLSSTGPARCWRLRCAHQPTTQAGPFDAISDSMWRRRSYSSGLRLLLLPALCLLRRFLASRFRFSLLRHLCPPSLWDGDLGTVQSRIDVHCTPITTAQRKKQRLRLRKRVCAARATRGSAFLHTQRRHHPRFERILDAHACKKFRHCRNADVIWVFPPSCFLFQATTRAQMFKRFARFQPQNVPD
jgi:hypothetical protein